LNKQKGRPKMPLSRNSSFKMTTFNIGKPKMPKLKKKKKVGKPKETLTGPSVRYVKRRDANQLTKIS